MNRDGTSFRRNIAAAHIVDSLMHEILAYVKIYAFTFRDITQRTDFSGQSRNTISFSFISWPLKTVPTRCPETSVRNYHGTLCNVLEDRRYFMLRGRNLKSRACNFVVLIPLIF